MAERGTGPVLATTRHNVRYLTGGCYHHFVERTGRSGHAQYLSVVGQTADLRQAFHVGGGDEATLIARFGGLWIEERLTAVRRQAMTAGSTLQGASALERRGLAGARIGVEFPFLPADAFEALRRRLPSATFVDASPLLGELRAIKRPDELDLLRRSHRIMGEAVAAAMTGVRPGASTQELAAAVERGVGARGAAFLYCLASVGPRMMRARPRALGVRPPPAPRRRLRGRRLRLGHLPQGLDRSGPRRGPGDT